MRECVLNDVFVDRDQSRPQLRRTERDVPPKAADVRERDPGVRRIAGFSPPSIPRHPRREHDDGEDLHHELRRGRQDLHLRDPKHL